MNLKTLVTFFFKSTKGLLERMKPHPFLYNFSSFVLIVFILSISSCQSDIALQKQFEAISNLISKNEGESYIYVINEYCSGAELNFQNVYYEFLHTNNISKDNVFIIYIGIDSTNYKKKISQLKGNFPSYFIHRKPGLFKDGSIAGSLLKYIDPTHEYKNYFPYFVIFISSDRKLKNFDDIYND